MSVVSPALQACAQTTGASSRSRLAYLVCLDLNPVIGMELISNGGGGGGGGGGGLLRAVMVAEQEKWQYQLR